MKLSIRAQGGYAGAEVRRTHRLFMGRIVTSVIVENVPATRTPHPEALGETPKLLRAELVDLSPRRKVVVRLHLLQPDIGGYLQKLRDLHSGAEHAVDREL